MPGASECTNCGGYFQEPYIFPDGKESKICLKCWAERTKKQRDADKAAHEKTQPRLFKDEPR